MKGIYITGKRQKLEVDGVEYKIHSQCETLRMYFNIDISVVYNPGDFFFKIKKYIPFFSEQIEFKQIHNLKHIDFFYFRKPIVDYNFIYQLSRIRRANPKLKIFMEIPTYPYDEELRNISSLLRIKDKFWRNQLYRVIDFIVTYSKDKAIFNVPTININNAANFESIQKKLTPFNKSKTINMTAIAYFKDYHGYDRLINGMGDYYKNNGAYDINLNLIGNGDSKVIEKYKVLITKYKLDNHVKLYNAMSTSDMTDIFNKTDIAIDTLARFRSGVFYNSTLKGKEYMARGVPIISGVETELDNLKFKYYYRVPSDESFINIDDIIKFYVNTVVNNSASDDEIVDYIRNYGIKKFSFKNSLQPIVDKLL